MAKKTLKAKKKCEKCGRDHATGDHATVVLFEDPEPKVLHPDDQKQAVVCYFDPKNASEGPCSDKIDPKEDYCFGCKKIICNNHAKNMNMPFGSHQPGLHLQMEDEDNDG